MDSDDLGDGWVDATGMRGGGVSNDRMTWSQAGITVGGLLMQEAGLEHGDRVRILLHREKQRVRLVRCDDDETTGNKITQSGTYSGKVAAGAARKLAGIEGSQELEVLAVEDGDIVGGYE